MKDFSFINSSPVYLEIGANFLRGLKDSSRIEFPLEREPDGKWTPACRERIASGLRAFADKRSFQPRARAYCAISATGVSLRRISLPASTKDKFEQVLLLQIEAEFPLAPAELAWGYQLLAASGNIGQQPVLIAAVKKEIIEEYEKILVACGWEPVFTLAGLARNFLCPHPDETHGMLEVGNERLELTLFEKGVATGIRVLPVTIELSADSLLKAAGANWNEARVYLTGANAELVSQFARRLSGRIECVPLPVETQGAAAILGLKKCVEQNDGAQLLTLRNRVKPPANRFNATSSESKRWLAAAAILLCVLLILPFAEAVILKPFLSRKLAVLKADQGRLATIDNELDFLQLLKQSQPPYLDALFVLAKSAPPGTRFDSLTINRRGEISMHGIMQNGSQVTDFRAKLIASGFFSSVSVEEQTPTPDRQRVNVRMIAQWKPAEARGSLAIGPTTGEIEQAKTNRDGAGGGGFPPGMMP